MTRQPIVSGQKLDGPDRTPPPGLDSDDRNVAEALARPALAHEQKQS
jgi:hypothetical protein